MDLSQALLYLLSFNSTLSTDGSASTSKEVKVETCHQGGGAEVKTVDLDFHSRELKTCGEVGTMGAIGIDWSIAPEEL